MYEPKLPVSGYPFAILAFTPFISKATIILLVITFTLVIFRFIRLLYRENNLINLFIILLTCTLIVISIFWVMKKYDSNSIENQVIESKVEEIDFQLNNEDKMIIKSGDLIGNLIIDKINLNIDVLEDSTDENMFIGAGHVLGTPYPWDGGNSFIASHNVKNYGLLFNRLHEVQIGDTITFMYDKNSIHYIVYNKEIVKGDNTECFSKLEGNRNLSLVTCRGDNRLILYCKEITN